MYQMSFIFCHTFTLLLWFRLIQSEVPKFTLEPSSRIVDAGSKVILDCVAEPVTAIIHWKHNRRFMYPDTERDVEIFSNRLVIKEFRPIRPYPHEEVYQCVATTSIGSIASRPARISSAPTDLFSEDDINVNVTEGNVAVIPCAPNVQLPNTEIWVEFNDELIKFNKDRYILMPSGNFQIASSQPSDSGVYRCIAYNIESGKSISSNGAIYLYVRAPSPLSPVIVLPPKDKNEVKLNSNLTLECAAVGYPTPNITWSKYVGQLPKDRSHQILGNLVITNVQRIDQGNFLCQAENNAGMGQTVVAAVEVREPPVIIKSPESKRVKEGESVQFECQVHGRPKPSIVWLHDGQHLGTRGGALSEDSRLTLVQAELSHAGIYQCIASNQLGSVYAVTMLEVEAHPITGTLGPPSGMVADSLAAHSRQLFTLPPQNQTVQVGMIAIMTCVMDYSTHPVITWYKNNQTLVGNPRFHKAASGTLQISNAQISDSGLYTCKAFTSHGQTDASAYLDVIDPSKTAPVKGKEETNHIFDHSHMSLLNMKASTQDDKEMQEDKKIQSHKKNKNKNHRNKNNKEKDSATKMIPPGKPEVIQKSDSSVLLTWDVPQNQGLPIIIFRVQYKEISKPNAQWMTMDEDILPNQRSYELAGLKAGQTYRFRMAAIYQNNDNKHGPNSKKFTLKESYHGQKLSISPHIIDAIPIGSSAITVYWEYAYSIVERIDGFRILYQPTDGKDSWRESEGIDPEVRHYIISYLLPNTLYQIKIKAFNSAGSSPDSKVYMVETNNSSMANDSDFLPGIDNTRRKSSPQDHDNNVSNHERDNGAGITSNSERDKESSFNSNNELLYMVLGIVLGSMVLLLAIFMIICGWKQRQQRRHLSIDPSIRDKYEDPAHRINLEQTGRKKGNIPVNGVQVMPTSQNGHIPHKQPKMTVNVNPMSKYDGDDDEKAPLHAMNGGFKGIISPNHQGDTNFNNLEMNKNTANNSKQTHEVDTNSINNSKNRSSSTSPHSLSPSSELTPPSPQYQQLPLSDMNTPVDGRTPQIEQTPDAFKSITESTTVPLPPPYPSYVPASSPKISPDA